MRREVRRTQPEMQRLCRAKQGFPSPRSAARTGGQRQRERKRRGRGARLHATIRRRRARNQSTPRTQQRREGEVIAIDFGVGADGATPDTRARLTGTGGREHASASSRPVASRARVARGGQGRNKCRVGLGAGEVALIVARQSPEAAEPKGRRLVLSVARRRWRCRPETRRAIAGTASMVSATAVRPGRRSVAPDGLRAIASVRRSLPNWRGSK